METGIRTNNENVLINILINFNGDEIHPGDHWCGCVPRVVT